MWDFDGDEAFFLLAAAAVAAVLGYRFIMQVAWVDPLVSRGGERGWLLVAFAGCFGLIWIVLGKWSDPETVRGHPDYMTLFLAGGAAWTLLGAYADPATGASIRDDAVERANPAATVAICGVMVGNALCYAGANIGAGPTIWTTILPAVGASGTLMAALLAIQGCTRAADLVAIERDVPASRIIAAFAVVAGALLGWAMAGNFESWGSTAADFARRAWLVVPMALVAVLALRWRQASIQARGPA